MLNMEALKAYELSFHGPVDELEGEAWLLAHRKTGARVLLIDNEDKNKVFSIAFRTPPADDTGLAHILEHSVLCGSRKFPSKDPFVELAKGSLNTFLNAMTYPDKTVYPIASCNDKDYHNLMHVYLDAVFYPNIYAREEILRQEGWHYEMEKAEDELTFNGVVYNEMKGALSSPDSILIRKIQASLLKDTPYAFESGGDPDAIPELTREGFLDFHRTYYHPSNSYIYLYGDVDFEKELTFIDQEYLAHFDRADIASAIPLQKAYPAPEAAKEYYSVSQEEEMKDAIYLSYNVVCGHSDDAERMMAMQLLDYVLISMPGAPVKKALIEGGLGKEVDSCFDNSIRQPIFSIIAKGVAQGKEEAFLACLEGELGRIVREGINKKAVYSAINNFEFKYREASFGRSPRGLIYGLNFLSSWLYDDQAALVLADSLTCLGQLRKKVETGYFEDLIRSCLLENTHKTYVNLYPELGKNERAEEKLRHQLAKVKAALNPKQLHFLMEETRKLKEYQQAPSSQEDLMKIPMLSISDIGKEVLPLSNREETIGGIPTVIHEIQTKGILYTDFTFDATELPYELIPYSTLLVDLFRYMDTDRHSYNDLAAEINLRIGDLFFSTGIFPLLWKKDGYRPFFSVRMKCLENQLHDGMELLKEVLFGTNFSDTKRLKEIISEIRSRMEERIPAAGHLYAANRALSYVDPMMHYKDIAEGLDYYDFIKRLDDSFDEVAKGVVKNIVRTAHCIFRKENLICSLTGDFDFASLLSAEFSSLADILYDVPCVRSVPVMDLQKHNEGIRTSSKVQYVATAGCYESDDRPYTGALRVLRTIMAYDYLWQKVRVTGGAYGCMCSFSRNGYGFFTSYRDPNLGATMDVYRAAGDYVRSFDVSDRDMTKYIIGTISGMDQPLDPVSQGDRSFGAWQCGITVEMLQAERDQVLACDQETIRGLASYIDSMIAEETICAIGSDSRLLEEKDLFSSLRSLSLAECD